MKIFKTCMVLALCIQLADMLRKMLIGQTDFVVEPVHILVGVVALAYCGVAGWFWIND